MSAHHSGPDEHETGVTAVPFDIARVPFSSSGSWMSVSVPKGESDPFLRNHHGGANNLFPLRTLAAGEVVKPVIEAVPWLLTFTHGEGRIECCFESPGTLRLRGQGLGLQLGDRSLICSEAPGRFVINCPRTRRYQVEVLRGGFHLRQLVATQPVFPRLAVVSPDNEGRWELAIDEFWSTWVRPLRMQFEACIQAAQKAFRLFLAAMPEVRPQDRPSRQLATYVDWSCTVGPGGLLKRPSILMSKCWMSNVWSWDHCFNAMALAASHPNLALDQMLTMVDHQDEFGSYPDSINDVWKHYNFSKPPVHGWAFSEMLRRMSRKPPAAAMRALYVSLSRQADWWMRHRTAANAEGRATGGDAGMPAGVSRTGGPTDAGARYSAFGRLPHYLHGNDSGWDNSTMMTQGVPLVAPDLAALLVVQMDVLADLAMKMNLPEEAASWRSRANALYACLMSELWRGDRFVPRLAVDGTVVECQSLIPWLPIILGERLPTDVRGALRAGIAGHLTEWGLATERVDSPRYCADGYWRGPIWAPATLLAVAGLDRCGFGDLADTVAERFCRLCGRSGFAENFDALTGAPLCDPAYTWTASVFLLLAQRMSRTRPAAAGGAVRRAALTQRSNMKENQ